MSDIKKQINKLVASKINNRSERLREAADDTEEVGNILTDYKLYFNGMSDALGAAGIDTEDYKAVKMASDTNETELKLVEQRMALEQELEDQE